MSEKRPELLIETGALAGRRFAVGDGGLRLGRSSSNDVTVPDEELSRNHCLFELSGESGVRVIDLASANGTYVNGEQVGADPVELRCGDVIKLGTTTVRVVGEGEPAPTKRGEKREPAPVSGDVDLGLGDAGSAADAPSPGGAAASGPRRRSPYAYALWAFAILILGLSVWLMLYDPRAVAPEAETDSGAEVEALSGRNRVVEMSYEKISADSGRIFRYHMDLAADGTLKVTVDDVPAANRHIVKSAKMDGKALGLIQEIFADPEFASLDREYAGPTEEPPRLEGCEVKVVFSGHVRTVRVVNTPEPDAFRRMRERLEAFTKNELGIWAIQYSSEKLIELSETSARTAQEKWNDRDVQYGNLHAAISAWREAMFYLETVNPKPAAYEKYRTAKETATAELEKRYAEQRFRADRAINLSDWAVAASELKILCEMVPDREDARYREASAKLVDVEKRQKKGAVK